MIQIAKVFNNKKNNNNIMARKCTLNGNSETIFYKKKKRKFKMKKCEKMLKIYEIYFQLRLLLIIQIY